MTKVASKNEIELAQHSVNALRHALNNSTCGVGSSARVEIKSLTTHVAAASTAVDVLRADPFSPYARSLIEQYDRLERAAREVVKELTANADYGGPRRGSMTVAEKSKYVSQHGRDAFESLPW